MTAVTEEPKGASLPAGLTAWIGDRAGGEVVLADRRPGGARREAWFVDVRAEDGELRRLFLRYDRSDPAVTGDPFTLRREARFYQALHGSAVPVPQVLGVHGTEQAILSERVPGETWFSRLRGEEQRLSVARDFMRILGALHRLDPSRLDLPGETPGDLESALTQELDRWEGLYRFKGGDDRPDPMIEFGLAWLRRHRPAATGPMVIVQGDTGPGNFLYRDGAVTAVLDWELGHFGDPMDDLGWLALRAVQEPFTTLADRLRDWERHTGWSVDLDLVRYYRVFAELRVLILGHGRSGGSGGSGGSGSSGDSGGSGLLGEVGNGLIFGQLHRRLYVEALADVLGAGLEEPPVPDAPLPEQDWLYEAAARQIRDIIVPRSEDPFVVLRAKGLARILKHLRQAARYGTAVADGELADLRELTGTEVADVGDGRAELARLLRQGRVPEQAALRYFGRRVARDTLLFRPAMGVLADRHFDELR